VKLFLTNSNACDHNPPTLQTDGRTDRRTDRRTIYHGNTPLRCASRGKNVNFRRPDSYLMPHIQRTPTNIRVTLIPLQTRVSALHFRHWHGSIFIQILVMASERQAHNVPEWIVALQGHPKFASCRYCERSFD